MKTAIGAALAMVALAGCGSTGHGGHVAASATAARSGHRDGPLVAFELSTVGSPTAGMSSWTQYGSKPVHRTLSINAVTVYDAGTEPLVLLGIRQAHPVAGLSFKQQLVTVTSGFAGVTEQVSAVAPAQMFGLGANFSPVRGYLVNPDPGARMGRPSPSLVVTATASRNGVFHLGNWVVTYEIGTRRYALDLADDGEFCVGANGCPQLG